VGVVVLVTAMLLKMSPAAAEEIHPQTPYVALTTLAGATGGAMLGVSLGGLSRNTAGSSVRPFMRWGIAGAALGGVVGRTVGLDLVGKSRGIGSAPPPSSRDAGAIAGMLIGEAIGFGLSAAMHQPINRDSREIWSGIALGAFVGAAAGYILPPMPFLAPPPEFSRADRERARSQRRIEAPLTVFAEDEGTLKRTVREDPSKSPEQKMPARDPGQARAIADSLLGLEQDRMIVPEDIQPIEPKMLLPDLAPPPRIVALSGLVTNLSLIEGAIAGGALGASIGGDSAGFHGRMAAGSVLGLLAGWSASSALTRTWGSSDPKEFTDMGEDLDHGRKFTQVLAGGLIGTIAGGIVGAILMNSVDDFEGADLARSALAGNLAGLAMGRILTSIGD